MVRKKKQTAKKQPIKKKRPPKKQILKEESQKPKLTLKQSKFLKYYLESGNVSQSALKAGYTHRQRGFELVSKGVIQEAYQILLDKSGITDKKLNAVLLKGLGTDLSTSHKYLETALKLKSRLINKTEHSGEVKGGDTKIIIVRADEKHGTKNKT